MGDFYNDSGFYEQSELRRANELAERDEAIEDMAEERGEMMEQLRIEQSEKEQEDAKLQATVGGDSGGSVSGAPGGNIGIGQQKPMRPEKTNPTITFWGVFWRVCCFWILSLIIVGAIDVGLLQIKGFSKFPGEALSISTLIAALAVALIWFIARYRYVASFYASLGFVFLVAIIIYGLANAAENRTVPAWPVAVNAMLFVTLVGGIVFLPIILIVGFQSLPGFGKQMRRGVQSDRYNWPIASIPLTVLAALVGYFGNTIYLFLTHLGISIGFLASWSGFEGCITALSVLARVVGVGVLLFIVWKAIEQTYTGVRQATK